MGAVLRPSREENDITGILQNSRQSSFFSFIQTTGRMTVALLGARMEQARALHEVCRHYLSLTMNTYLTLSISSDSTFGPNCVHDAHQAAIYYFTSTLSLFKNSRRTPGSLKVVTPLSTNTYTREDIVNILQSACDVEVGLDCKSGKLFQVNYYYSVSVDPTHDLFCPFC